MTAAVDLPSVSNNAAAKVELAIPCEFAADGSPCGRPADVWVVMHDVCGDCRGHDGGTLSQYMCHQCWDPLAAQIVANLRLAAAHGPVRLVVQCATCGLHIHRWSDVVYRVVTIRGTKR